MRSGERRNIREKFYHTTPKKNGIRYHTQISTIQKHTM